MSTKSRFLVLGAVLLLGLISRAGATGYVWEYVDGKECKFGADIRLRLTHIDRDVFNPENTTTGNPEQYIRVRERIWGCVDITEDTMFNFRIVNEWRDYSSRNGRNSQGARTYEFPDEFFFDNFFVDFKNMGGSHWSLRLGRQDFLIGNGMAILEGNPGDAGRSIYVDGAVAAYETERDNLKLFGFYNTWKDRFLMINDQERMLRPGNIGIFGLDWTHFFKPSVSTELYGFRTKVDDDGQTPRNNNSAYNTFGFRVFGDPAVQFGYSLEAAKQMGEHSSSDADFTGTFLDGRIYLKPLPEHRFNPKVTIQYTMFSGDDKSSGDEYEGWYPIHIQYPIWREEHTLWQFRDDLAFNPGTGIPAYWSNLNRLHTDLKLQLHKKVTLTTAWDWLRADHGDNGTGGGNNYGHLLSAFLDIKATDNLSIAFEAAGFFAGDYYNDGQDSEWLRFQAVYTF